MKIKKYCFIVLFLAFLLMGLPVIEANAISEYHSYNEFLEETTKKEYLDLMEQERVAGNFTNRVYTGWIEEYSLDWFRIEVEEFVVEYFIAFPFKDWSAISIEELFKNIAMDPTIYVPVYTEVAGSERIFGHITMHNYFDHYDVSPAMLLSPLSEEPNSEHFLSIAGSFNSVRERCTALGLENVSDAILLRLPEAVNDYTAKIVLLETEAGFYVFDFMNTAQVDGVESAVYTLEEYAELRKPFEEEHFQTAVNIEKDEFGGQTLNGQLKKGLDDPRFLIAVIVLATVVIAVGGWILYRHLRRRKIPAENV